MAFERHRRPLGPSGPDRFQALAVPPLGTPDPGTADHAVAAAHGRVKLWPGATVSSPSCGAC